MALSTSTSSTGPPFIGPGEGRIIGESAERDISFPEEEDAAGEEVSMWPAVEVVALGDDANAANVDAAWTPAEPLDVSETPDLALSD